MFLLECERPSFIHIQKQALAKLSEKSSFMLVGKWISVGSHLVLRSTYHWDRPLFTCVFVVEDVYWCFAFMACFAQQLMWSKPSSSSASCNADKRRLHFLTNFFALHCYTKSHTNFHSDAFRHLLCFLVRIKINLLRSYRKWEIGVVYQSRSWIEWMHAVFRDSAAKTNVCAYATHTLSTVMVRFYFLFFITACPITW